MTKAGKNAMEDFMTAVEEPAVSSASRRAPAASPPAAPAGRATMPDGQSALPPPAAGFEPDDVKGEDAPAETVVTDFDEADYRVHRLRTTVTRDGEKLLRVRLRPVVLEDIDDWSSGSLSNRDLLVRLTGLSALTLKKLAWDDAESVMAIFQQIVPEFVFAPAKSDDPLEVGDRGP